MGEGRRGGKGYLSVFGGVIAGEAGGGGESETRVIPVKAEAAEASPDGSREEGEGTCLALMTVLRCAARAQGTERSSEGNEESASPKGKKEKKDGGKDESVRRRGPQNRSPRKELGRGENDGLGKDDRRTGGAEAGRGPAWRQSFTH